MRNKYNIILITAIAMSTFSLVLIITHKLNHNSFPFGIGVDSLPAPIPILEKEFGDEYETIMAAASRNNCVGEDLVILFAIRKAENGPFGNEFGIMCQKGTNLDVQTGWAAATIVKNRKQWTEAQEKLFGYKGFIVFLGNKYCPLEVDKTGNINWIRNVTYWYEKFKGKENAL